MKASEVNAVATAAQQSEHKFRVPRCGLDTGYHATSTGKMLHSLLLIYSTPHTQANTY